MASAPAWGLILLDKPSGPTSHDMVYAVRRGAGQKRVGHAGTLDPLATGLLVMCLGPATRLSEYLAGKDKRYTARLRLGQATDTYDAQGQVTSTSPDLPEQAAVDAALAAFRGPQQQVPPAFSAIQRGGQRAYDLARRGETVVLEPRPVVFYSIELVGWQPPELTLDVHCSAGTYIRSLAHDLGQRLRCGAHLSGLRRTASGSLSLDQSVPLDQLQAAFARGDWQQYLRAADTALADWPAVNLSAADTVRVLRGQSVPFESAAPSPTPDRLGRAYNPAGEFIAVLRADQAAGVWRPDKVFTLD
jgi:tRNA pseudouridine55 synthase